MNAYVLLLLYPYFLCFRKLSLVQLTRNHGEAPPLVSNGNGRASFLVGFRCAIDVIKVAASSGVVKVDVWDACPRPAGEIMLGHDG